MQRLATTALSRMLKQELLDYGRAIGAPVKQSMTKAKIKQAIETHQAAHGTAVRQAGVPPTPSTAKRGAAPALRQPPPAPSTDDVAPGHTQASPPPGSSLQEAWDVVRERWKSFSVVGAVIPSALFVDYYFFQRLGAHGEMGLSDRLMVWRAWPLLVVASVAALVVFLPLLGFVVWQRRTRGVRSVGGYAWWIATTGVTAFIVAFLLTSALGAVKNATVRIQAGQEVSAVLTPMTQWPLYFSDAYYVERVTFRDRAEQQRLDAREPGEPLTYMYLRAEGDAQDKRVVLYDYESGDVVVEDVLELCAGSRWAPALSIDCVR